MDEDDLRAEGRAALLAALPKYDPAADASVQTYAKGVLAKKYGNILREALAWKRRPHMKQTDSQGVAQLVACPTLHLDAARHRDALGESSGQYTEEVAGSVSNLEPPFQLVADDDMADPVEVAERNERQRLIMRVLFRVRQKLSDLEAKILDCHLRPPAAMLIATRNMGGGNRSEGDQIAFYLGITASAVDYALRRVRRLAAGVIEDEFRARRHAAMSARDMHR